MKGEWCYYKNYFSKEQCDFILQEGLKIPAENAKLGVDGSSNNSDIRKSKIRFIQKDNPAFTWLFDKLMNTALECNDLWFNFHLSKLSYIQLAEYDASYQGEYKRHHDVFWMNNDPMYHRKLSGIVQLTDSSVYEGGNFELFNLEEYPNSNDIRTQGTVTFFPSFLEHRAMPVTKGTRYSLACWFDGPKWK